jgi:RNase P subunit RPR2
MLLITCPVTRTDELVADRHIRSVTNHPTHITMHVECPACGGVHRYPTGRRWEQARALVAATPARTARVGIPA